MPSHPPHTHTPVLEKRPIKEWPFHYTIYTTKIISHYFFLRILSNSIATILKAIHQFSSVVRG